MSVQAIAAFDQAANKSTSLFGKAARAVDPYRSLRFTNWSNIWLIPWTEFEITKYARYVAITAGSKLKGRR